MKNMKNMKSNNLLLYAISLFVSAITIISCKNNLNPNRVYFSIDPENRQIIIPVQLNDSVVANMIFDTGACAHLGLDSSFCASNHLDFNLNNQGMPIRTGLRWTYDTVLGTAYNRTIDVKIGNIDLSYSMFQVWDWRGHMNSNDSDGLFGIPNQDSTHVFELNFEHNYLEIHFAADFKMPKNCFIVPIERNRGGHYTFEIQLPMQIKYADGDILTMNRTYLVDTGMFYDVALIYPAEEKEFFDKKKDAIWIKAAGGDGYSRRYTVNATLFNSFAIDSLRIYTFDDPRQVSPRYKYLLGQNFLKRFNVFFDLKNGQMGLQPIKNYQRVVNPLVRQFHYATGKAQNGKIIVSKVADYAANYFMTAGLREGDEIVSVDGKPYDNYSYDYLQYNRDNYINVLRDKNIICEDYHFFKGDTLVYDIVRQGNPMKIVVPVDKNEEKGD
jgi:hypothetical protein